MALYNLEHAEPLPHDFSSVEKNAENRDEWHWDREGLGEVLDADLTARIVSWYALDYQALSRCTKPLNEGDCWQHISLTAVSALQSVGRQWSILILTVFICMCCICTVRHFGLNDAQDPSAGPAAMQISKHKKLRTQTWGLKLHSDVSLSVSEVVCTTETGVMQRPPKKMDVAGIMRPGPQWV
jgi:hypothetical protein